jgi:LysM repeat protein
MTISANPSVRVVVLLITVAVVLVLLLATGVGASVGTSVSLESAEFVTHQVADGDTLWDIASVHTPPSEDVRRTVYEIRVANGLEGSLIVPGQILRIPVVN